MENNNSMPIKERIKLRNKKIKMFYQLGFSMAEVCTEMKKLGYNVSTTTVFFAINGRSKKKESRRKKKREVRRLLKSNSK